MAKSDPAGKKQPRRPWRDNVEAITMAIVMAVMLKYFIVEAYKIPTGSMQPTLMGNDETGIYDRILVDKLSFHYRDPKRFEVVVFKYPLDRSKNFIKRIAGVGPEWFRIEHGDLWRSDLPPDRMPEEHEWEIVRRPHPVQREVWKPLFPMQPGSSRWGAAGGARGWTITPDEITAAGGGTLRFPESGHVTDDYRDGYPQAIRQKLLRSKPPRHQVGDLRFDADVRPSPELAALLVRLHEGGRQYHFELPGPAAGADARPRISLAGDVELADSGAREVAAEEPRRMRANRSQHLAVQSMDDLLVLEWNGEELCRLEIPASADQRAFLEVELVPSAGAPDGAQLARLRAPMVYRDIYYTTATSRMSTWYVPGGHFVMLGDNTQDSSDSREWTLARMDWPDAGGVLRGNNLQGKNPMSVQGLPSGPMWWFRDEWGELWTAPLAHAQRADPPVENAPFVPRELITGRALVVFWPLKWDLRLWRLQWIR